LSQKIIRSLLIVFIVFGITLAAVNFFAPNLYAPTFFGAVTYIGGEPNPNNPAWIEGGYYCAGNPDDCVVVYPI